MRFGAAYDGGMGTITPDQHEALRDLLVLTLARNCQKPFGEQAEAVIALIEKLVDDASRRHRDDQDSGAVTPATRLLQARHAAVYRHVL